ncbi:hypothetical protein F8M41_000269 [Gigaspora margarita]|uniref:Uncharacterized protein n=1 Tax=Gigaspora margarita TaxID=4874 RepID=A0A8H4ESR7_GIGMA|nr:hypothetical protein F8M41_000269 [Gigaspora margarita]
MPELADRHSSLATYIICQKHYNQIVVNDYYNLASLTQEENQPDTNQNNIAIKCQRNEIAELKNKLQKVYDDVFTVRNLFEEQLNINNALVEQWNSQFDSQQKRINAIVEIAKAERMSLYEDLEQLIQNRDRFSLENLKYEELFDINSQMQEIVNKELHAYLAEILNLLSEEKSSSTNIIDFSIASTMTNTTNMKMCLEIQKEKKVEAENSTVNQLNNPFIFKPYNINEEQINLFTPNISLTQQSVTDPKVNIPEIYIPDPININPNSLANVEKVLVHIEKISGIKDGICKWVVVTCDGVSYHHATKLRKKFPWNIDLKHFAVCQGYRTENQLFYFKKCADHHKSWDSICNIYRQAMAMELLWPYVKSHSNPSVEEYLVWAKEQQSPLYQIKYEQVIVIAVLRHPIYRLIEVADEIHLMQLYPEIHDIIEKNCVVSYSGIYEQHQGLDAIIEEANKALKTLIHPVPQQRHWKIAARNYKKFIKLRNNLFRTIGYNDQQSVPRTRPDSTMECQRFCALLRSLEFVNPINTQTVCQSLGREFELAENLKNFTQFAKEARQKFITEVFINKSKPSFFKPIPITKKEAISQNSEENMPNNEILAKIETFLEQLGENARKNYPRLKSKNKSELLIILQELRCLFNSDSGFYDQDNIEIDQQE